MAPTKTAQKNSIPSIPGIPILRPQYRHCAMCDASQWECALFFCESHAHGARGETLLFPPCPPLSPVCCRKACGTLCGFFKLEALASSPPRAVRRRLSARCHSAAPNILGAVAAPLCSDSLPRPLRARRRRASPRVLELHRDVLSCAEARLGEPFLPFADDGRGNAEFCAEAVRERTKGS